MNVLGKIIFRVTTLDIYYDFQGSNIMILKIIAKWLFVDFLLIMPYLDCVIHLQISDLCFYAKAPQIVMESNIEIWIIWNFLILDTYHDFQGSNIMILKIIAKWLFVDSYGLCNISIVLSISKFQTSVFTQKPPKWWWKVISRYE